MIEYVRNIDWLVSIQILGGIVGAALSFITILSIYTQYKNRSRNRLKDDLEILKQFDKEDPNYLLIKNAIDKKVKNIYSERVIVHKWLELIFGIAYTIGFAIWASNVYDKNGASLGFSILVIYSINGIVYVIDSFIERGLISILKE